MFKRKPSIRANKLAYNRGKYIYIAKCHIWSHNESGHFGNHSVFNIFL